MGVPGDDERDFCGFGHEVEVVQVMYHVHQVTAHFEGIAAGQLRGPRSVVAVPTHRSKRSDLAQDAQDLESTNVSCVQQ